MNHTRLHQAFNSQMLWLDLGHNHLVVVPHQINVLHHLKVLNLTHNRLTYVPSFTLTHLEVLILSHNRLSVISAVFSQFLSTLKHVDFSNNQIFYFCPSSYPRNLKTLRLGTNKLYGLDLQRIQMTLKELTIGVSPWICDCMFEILNFINGSRIRQPTCETSYLDDGGFAVCVIYTMWHMSFSWRGYLKTFLSFHECVSL